MFALLCGEGQLNSLWLINKYISHSLLRNISQPHTRHHKTEEMLISCFISGGKRRKSLLILSLNFVFMLAGCFLFICFMNGNKTTHVSALKVVSCDDRIAFIDFLLSERL